jgi:hypothetical protein
MNATGLALNHAPKVKTIEAIVATARITTGPINKRSNKKSGSLIS